MAANARKTTISTWNPKIITFKTDNRHLMSGAPGNSYPREWTVDGGGEVDSWHRMESPGIHVINAIAASMDGRWIVAGDAGNQVIVWDAVTRAIARQISEHTGPISDKTVRIFNIISGIRPIPPLVLGNSVTPMDVKFSPDGSRIATAACSLFCIFDAQSGNKLVNFPVQHTSISSLAWSFDSQQLFIVSPSMISRFDTSESSDVKLQCLRTDTNNNDTPVVVTHGRFVACATGLRVLFWDYTLGEQIGSILDHASPISCIAISRDGKYLACGYQNGITVYHLADILPGDYLRVPRIPRIPLVEVDDPVLEPWRLGNLTDALSILSKESQNAQDSDPSHHAHALAARSIIQSRLRNWSTAIEDAKKSLQVKQSAIGQIARSLALVGTGKQEVALDDFELAFCDCDPSDITLLVVIKSILAFMCGKHQLAVSHLQHLITAAGEKTKAHYILVLGNMYLKQRDYENTVQTLMRAKKLPPSQDPDPLMTISLIFDWDFDRLEDIAYQRLCESLYPSGRIKEVGEALLNMVNGLTEDEKEPAHGRILEELVTRSGQVTLLMWTGKSSRCNSCLPSSPAVYTQQSFVPPHFEPSELKNRTDKLRTALPHVDAAVLYSQATCFQPVRFAHFHLHLPCIVYEVKSLKKMEGNVYHAETAEFGNVEFTTGDSLSFKKPQRLVFADLRIHGLRLESDTDWSPSDVGNSIANANAELVHAPMIEEVPSEPQLDAYTRALQLIVRLGQPFSALLLLRQSDGSYRRVAADNEIVVRNGTGENVTKNVRVEVLEVL